MRRFVKTRYVSARAKWLLVLIAIVAFIAYALYQGSKVKKPPQNVPEDAESFAW